MASIRKLSDGRWQARYRIAPGGRQYSKTAKRKRDVERWLDEQTASIVTGQFVDPRAGSITFQAYAEDWRKRQVHRLSSEKHVETMLRRHAYPFFGDRMLTSITPDDVQLWVRRLEKGDGKDRKPLAPATIGVVHAIVSSVFKAACRPPRRLAHNPCSDTKLPEVQRSEAQPLTADQVRTLTKAMGDLGIIVTLGVGSGMRQGECLGLTLDRVNFLKRSVYVDRQLVTVPGREPFLAPPKSNAAVRTIPLPQFVLEALAVHVATNEIAAGGFLFAIDGKPISRSLFGHLWRPAVTKAGLPKGTGFHRLRHTYVSALIDAGESPKVVQKRVGHKSGVTTLDVYGHMWPDGEDRTRDALDSVFGNPAEEPLRNMKGDRTRTRRSDDG
jgi:integrase